MGACFPRSGDMISLSGHSPITRKEGLVMKHLFDNLCPRCKTIMILTHPRDHAVPIWICPVCGKTCSVALPMETEALTFDNPAERLP